ncbi:MAG: excinuclease ABC subunit UvrA [Deltaproteobacteria bacterium]|nr:excinuclease ABC subunit UvrA [Deltaproteobacteria bacterium]
MAKGAYLNLIGVRQNNLKNLNLCIAHDELVAITGVSGSGKSSLAFDTIYAEGARRYIETFSPYTRQFLDRLAPPELDCMSGVRPAIALEQRNRVTSSRSTVGTITEINDYLKVIWAHYSSIICPTCKKSVTSDTAGRIIESIVERFVKKEISGVAIAFALKLTAEVSVTALRDTLLVEGFVRFFRESTRQFVRLDDLCDNDLRCHGILNPQLIVVVDRLIFEQSREAANQEPISKALRQRLIESIEQGYKFGHGHLITVLLGGADKQLTPLVLEHFSKHLFCSTCKISFRDVKPAHFSFNSPLGACDVCNGFGSVLAVNAELCVPDPSRSINEKALSCWATNATAREFAALKKFCARRGINVKIPWQHLPQEDRDLLFSATKKTDGFDGVCAWFNKLQRKSYKMHVRVFISRYRTQVRCYKCNGSRLKPEALIYCVEGKKIDDIWRLSISESYLFFEGLLEKHAQDEIAKLTIREVVNRLKYLNDIGLGYLTLDRQTRSLSGGECQRANLTTLLGSQLVNTTVVLDEPSIGLHRRDTDRLLSVLKQLRDAGNSVIVVEHDEDVICAADSVIDLGPGAGSEGGSLVFQGSLRDFQTCDKSLTAKHLFSLAGDAPTLVDSELPSFNSLLEARSQRISIKGARANNLKNIDVDIPLDRFVVVTGVSGSGKTTLVDECLCAAGKKLKSAGLASSVSGGLSAVARSIDGLELIDDIIRIDQSPVARSPRSNCATYTKMWDVVRDCFAKTDKAKSLGLGKSAFSFNVEGGRCPECKGAGAIRVEMQFLADVYVTCEACNGLRFKETVLDVIYAGKNIVDILRMTLSDMDSFFCSEEDKGRSEEIKLRLRPLLDLGLGYLQLGQSLSELSGGESQRLKLASYLKPSSSKRLLFVLDEPTTGLHPHDVKRLLNSLRTLVSSGHSVICIEHNLNVISSADWIIDLGPDGGDGGGEVVAEGPLQLFLEDNDVVHNSHTSRALQCRNRILKNDEPTNDKASSALVHCNKEECIGIIGVKHHNLKNISVFVPKDKLTVITGISGSGKSTLAFDVLFAEGQRRYIDSLSPYARQYITQLERPEVAQLTSLPPTIAISQKTAPPLGVSTIATTTEVYQFLRLLYAKVGIQHCPEHGVPVSGFSKESIAEELLRSFQGQKLFLYAPVVSGRKGTYGELFDRACAAEISEAKIDNRVVSIYPDLRLQKTKLHWISLLVASLKCSRVNYDLLLSGIDQCLLLGNSVLEVAVDDKWADVRVFSTSKVCPECRRGFRALDPQDFSFRSRRGQCEGCEGRGGEVLLDGTKQLCAKCHGARIAAIGRNVFVNGYAIHDLTACTAPQLLKLLGTFEFSENLKPLVQPIMLELKSRLGMIAELGLDYLELDRESSSISGGEAQRLRLSRALGAPLSGVCYVLDEPTIGLHPKDHSQLMSMLFALRDIGNTVVVVEHDEGTIRQADHVIDIGPTGGAGGGELVFAGMVDDLENNSRSLTGLALRERRLQTESGGGFSNSIVACAAIGKQASKFLKISSVNVNNLRDISAEFLLCGLTVVAGVSGAGKSSLVHGALVPRMLAHLSGNGRKNGHGKGARCVLEGHEAIRRIVIIDQTPIGRSIASTPASFLRVFDEIRAIYASLPESRARGWSASQFSFNTAAGRCTACKGRGFLTIPMSFLPEARSVCEVCGGSRYDESIMSIGLQGVAIGELLEKTMDEARLIFQNYPKIRRVLDCVSALGIGYLTLGQPTYTLSGGEAKRLKIARELGMRSAVDTLYVMDEPTMGLHMADVEKLLKVTFDLIALGNTVVMIEHDLDVICKAEHLIELGPGAGKNGGKVVFTGRPAELVMSKCKTATASCLRLKFGGNRGDCDSGKIGLHAANE